MPFMVIYSRSDGTSCYEQVEAIDEAALFVERLRNSEQNDQIRIYRMEEISFAFRPYFKVELGLPERHGPQLSSLTEPMMAPVAEGDVGPEPDQAVGDDPAADNGRRGLFGR